MIIERVYLSDRTLGSWYNEQGEMIAKTLELPWLNNSKQKSCIPEGTYDVIKEPPKADRPYTYFRLLNVPGRGGILIHRGVKPLHSKGCLLVGSRFAEVNSNTPILESSTIKMDWLAANLPDKFKLTIKKK